MSKIRSVLSNSPRNLSRRNPLYSSQSYIIWSDPKTSSKVKPSKSIKRLKNNTTPRTLSPHKLEQNFPASNDYIIPVVSHTFQVEPTPYSLSNNTHPVNKTRAPPNMHQNNTHTTPTEQSSPKATIPAPHRAAPHLPTTSVTNCHPEESRAWPPQHPVPPGSQNFFKPQTKKLPHLSTPPDVPLGRLYYTNLWREGQEYNEVDWLSLLQPPFVPLSPRIPGNSFLYPTQDVISGISKARNPPATVRLSWQSKGLSTLTPPRLP